MISLDEELFYKLQNETNASGLIQELLYKYYGTPRNIDDISKIDNKITELQKLADGKTNDILNEIKELEEHKNKIVKAQEEVESKTLHRTTPEEKRIKRQELFFVEVGRYMTDEEMKEFEKRFEFDGIGILQFIEEKKGNEVKEAEKVLDVL